MALVDVGITQVNAGPGVFRQIPHRLDASVEFVVAAVLAPVGDEVVFVKGRGTRCRCRARGAGVLDPAAAVLVHEHTAQAEVLRHRRVDDSGDIAHLIGVFIALAAQGDLVAEFISGVGGSEVQGAPYGVAPEKSPLGAPQDFQALHVRQGGVDHARRHGGNAEAIHVHADGIDRRVFRRAGDHVADAANGHPYAFAAHLSVIGERHIGRQRKVVPGRPDVALFDCRASEGGHAHRHILEVLLPALRCYNNFFQRLLWIGGESDGRNQGSRQKKCRCLHIHVIVPSSAGVMPPENRPAFFSAKNRWNSASVHI